MTNWLQRVVGVYIDSRVDNLAYEHGEYLGWFTLELLFGLSLWLVVSMQVEIVKSFSCYKSYWLQILPVKPAMPTRRVFAIQQV